jgi:nucleoside-diphosphate-sugar epimerase
MSTYLVTGATGFVGRALIRRLVQNGHAVRAAVRSRETAAGLDGASVHEVSLADPNALAEIAAGSEVVFHCAAENSARAVPAAYGWINVAGTENVLNAARHAGVRRVVHLSCADSTLVDRDRLNWKEDQQLGEQPLDALCRSKLLAEELAAGARGLEVCVLRPAWVWGPGDRRVLPTLCREDQRGRVRLCGDGENLLATIYIDNLIDALIAAAGASLDKSRIFHVVDGEAMTAREFLSQLCRSVGLKPPARGVYPLAYALAWLRDHTGLPGLARVDVVRRGRGTLFDASAALRELGYEPRVSVADGMRALAAWANEVGGPSAIANLERKPATRREVDALMRVADAG